MPSWGNNDNAANTPLWSTAAVKVAPTTQNTANLFQNTTQGYWEDALPNGGDRLANVAIGVFGVDADEADVNNQGVHTGWVLRTEGSGGRAGRVLQEVLVAMSTMNSDGNSPVYPDSKITITSQPGANTANVTAGGSATFRVTAAITEGKSVALSYQWQRSATLGGTYVDVSDGVPANTTYSGGTTAALVVTPTGTDAANNYYRVVVSATGTEATATSTPAKLTIVS